MNENENILAFDDEFYMRQAFIEAQKAYDLGEIPVGAIIVSQGVIIARGHNLTERLNDVTAHAEMQAITAAAEYLGGKYLKDCTIYVTLEPCYMCAGALAWAQISRLVYAASDSKRGYSSFTPSILHKKTEIVSGVLEDLCSKIIKDFFIAKR